MRSTIKKQSRTVNYITVKHDSQELGWSKGDTVKYLERRVLWIVECAGFYDTGIPRFSKVRFTPLHVYERPALGPVLANRRKPKEDFHFYEKREKGNLRSVYVLQCTPPSPGTTLSLPASRRHSFERGLICALPRFTVDPWTTHNWTAYIHLHVDSFQLI